MESVTQIVIPTEREKQISALQELYSLAMQAPANNLMQALQERNSYFQSLKDFIIEKTEV